MPEAQFALAQAAIYLVAGAEVRRRQTRARRGARPHPRARRRAAPGAAAVRGLPGARARWAAGRATTTRTTTPGHINAQEHLPEGLEDLRLYAPDDAEADAARALERIRRERRREP